MVGEKNYLNLSPHLIYPSLISIFETKFKAFTVEITRPIALLFPL